jgi:hypothetical protein
MGKTKPETIEKWKREHVKRFTFYINKDTEADALNQFEKQPSKRQYLVDLIRKDIKGDAQ